MSEASAITYILTSEGEVWSCGDGSCSALGHGDLEDRNVPTRIEALTEHVITRVAAGSAHAVFLAATGAVFTVGLCSGATGHGDGESRTIPARIRIRRHRLLPAAHILHIGAADQLTVLVDATGCVYACGVDRGGEWEEKYATRVMGSLRAKSGTSQPFITGLACGGVMNIHFILKEGTGETYHVAGANNNAQLGQGDRDSSFEWPPIEMGAGITLSRTMYGESDSDELILRYNTAMA